MRRVPSTSLLLSAPPAERRVVSGDDLAIDTMTSGEQAQDPGQRLKRIAFLAIFALSWTASGLGWLVMGLRGRASPVLEAVFGANLVFHPVMFAMVWKQWLPQRIVDISCLAFAAGICGACMLMRLYWPVYGADIDLRPLYLWIPVIYVFTFTLAGHRSSLRISLLIMALFVAISLPYLAWHYSGPYANFTIQLHMISAVLIAALYFFSSYQHRLQVAHLTVDELALLSNTDELTGLPNRRRVGEVLHAELVRFANTSRTFAVLMIDVDHFKAVNDRFGHAAGDDVLVALAARTAGSLRAIDLLGRWGGEEFVAILPEITSENTMHLAESLRQRIAASPLPGGQVVTISCGAACARPGDTAEALLERADAALYAAKRRGRNRVECADSASGPVCA